MIKCFCDICKKEVGKKQIHPLWSGGANEQFQHGEFLWYTFGTALGVRDVCDDCVQKIGEMSSDVDVKNAIQKYIKQFMAVV